MQHLMGTRGAYPQYQGGSRRKAEMTKEWDAAVTRADVAALQRLLDGGADPDARDPNGQTALLRAAQRGVSC
jgi:ankyrin repeat protein